MTITGFGINNVASIAETNDRHIIGTIESISAFIEETTKIVQNADYFRPMFIITGIWKEAGYSSIVFFAAIMAISPVLYEAIKVDGGNKLQEIRYVTFPGMAPTLIIMIVLRIGRMLSVGFERVILLYNANTYETADTLATFVLRIGLEGEESSHGRSRWHVRFDYRFWTSRWRKLYQPSNLRLVTLVGGA